MIPVITIISVHWFVIVMVCLIVKSRTLYKIMYIWNPMLFFQNLYGNISKTGKFIAPLSDCYQWKKHYIHVYV